MSSKKTSGYITIEITITRDISFDEWKAYSKTDANDFEDEKDYEKALEYEWEDLKEETNGRIEIDDDGTFEVEDDKIEEAFDDFECGITPEELKKHLIEEKEDVILDEIIKACREIKFESAKRSKIRALFDEYSKISA